MPARRKKMIGTTTARELGLRVIARPPKEYSWNNHNTPPSCADCYFVSIFSITGCDNRGRHNSVNWNKMYFRMGKARIREVFSLGIVLACCVCAFGLDPSLDISQYSPTSWKVRDGFAKGEIVSIAQTPDGYLWLGTGFGF